MNALLAVAAAVVALGVALEVVRRAREGRQTVEAHHRALDTLGQLTASHHDDVSGPPTGEAAHQHVRVLPATQAGRPAARQGTVRHGRRPGPLPSAGPLPRPPAAPARRPEGPPVRYHFDALTPPEERGGPDVLGVAPHGGTIRNGTIQNGTIQNGTIQNGTIQNGTIQNGTVEDGSIPDGTAPGGAPVSAPIPAGRPALSRVTLRPPRRRHGHRRSARWYVTGGLAAAVAAGAVVAGLSAGHSPTPAAQRHTPPSRAASTSTTTVATTTTTVAAARLVSSSGGTAVYQLTGGAPVQLSTSGRCWVEIRQTDASGPLVFEGVLNPGDTRSVTGPSWLRLGNPGVVSVSVAGQAIPVNTPAPGTPVNLQFQ